MAPWQIAVLCVVPVVGLVALVLWARRGMAEARRRLTAIAEGRVARREVVAHSFGLRSSGAMQPRGAGYLALFDDELVFVQAIAKNHVRAKLADIVVVTTPRSFLGKTQGVKLLAVEWRDGDGSDQIAWRVPELDPWLDALAGAGVSVRRPAEARDP